ncbi:ABC transporter permease subunit [Tessaracoccus sp. OH4464_COT-324]|uniref:ABC transporter permease subunit n=1 Tax=Tessaracoccus sp. OH4464_COT-324 TaxID=2491059 RepID=UPI000F63E489|nr:ABC transporter permease subunit [Tessaracoccus sp. OH4464_COT-324]RRD46391.1 ABC transporter permease subunit [Tessaracoccus sp. OH4464_COT-324]
MSKSSVETPPLSHARDISRPGFYVKLILMLLVNALGLYGVMATYALGEWAILSFLVVSLVIADYVYFSSRAIPAKYLYPGLIFLAVYQVYVMGMTGFVAFTNYGDGHNDTKAAAVKQILATSEVDTTDSYPVSVIERDGVLGLAVVRDGKAQAGTAQQPLAELTGATVEGDRVTAAEGYTVLTLPQLTQRQEEVLGLRVAISEDPEQGSLRTRNGTTATQSLPQLSYDESADKFTDVEGTVYSADDSIGNYVADNGKKLEPGWRVIVGLKNFSFLFTNPDAAGYFLGSLGWTFAFAILSVLTTFALGLLIAVVFNDPRVKGRVVYRALFILPYAFPGFLAALVWRGMLNRQFGFVNETLLGGAAVNWLGDPFLAKVSILMVNLWLGFPYMFLVCTGALQAIPGELTEAGVMDGAGPIRRFFNVTLPMLMVSVAPLLIASFAFNFNNFSLIYMLTDGGPNYAGAPFNVGATDILISMVYAMSFESEKQYGLASALSIIIFVVVGIVSWLGFRQTRKLEEIM